MSPLLRRKSASKKRASTTRGSQTILLLDLGSGSVGAALVRLAREALPEVLAHRRVSLRLVPNRTITELQSRLFSAIDEVLRTMQHETHRRTIRHTAIFVPAPWAMLDLHKVRFAQSQAFLADTALMHRLIKEHVAQESIEEARTASVGEEVFERVVAGVRLNGYVSPSLPKDTTVFQVEMMLGAARASSTFLDRVATVVESAVPAAGVSFHSSVLSAGHALSDLGGDAQPFLLCDGEGELAELLLVRETIPEAHATIPVGFANILRTLAIHSGATHSELSSLLALMSDARSPLSQSANEALTLATKQCSDALGAAEPLCAAFAPQKCYVVGDGPEAAWFAHAVEKSPRLRLALPRGFRAEVVTASSLLGHVQWAPGTSNTMGDAMLGLHALFAHDRFIDSNAQEFYTS